MTNEDLTTTVARSQRFCPYCGSWLAAGEPHTLECTGPDGPQLFCPDCGYKNPGPSHDFGCSDMYVS